MRRASTVVFCAIDAFIPPQGKILPGFAEFTAALDQASIPTVWLTSRTRLQIDDARRKLGHTHPFIAEDGCGVYLPEDYFHLRPAKTQRLGRFTCIPIAQAQPAAAQALETLSEETEVPVVALRSLSPRELAQNSGLPAREVEFIRQRDFDEMFFFAGASQSDIDRFLSEGRSRNLQLRRHGILWSLALGASVGQGMRELSKLFDRALHAHTALVGVAMQDQANDLVSACDRSILLTNQRVEESPTEQSSSSRIRLLPLRDPDVWERLLASITTRD